MTMSTPESLHPYISPELLIQQLNWRYATKKFNPGRTIDPVHWAALEDALVLSPSSFGLQPWKFFVVTNQAMKEKLVPVSWNQRQVADASHVVVFAIKNNLNAVDVQRFIDRIVEVRGVSAESIEGYKKIMVGAIGQMGSEEVVNHWATRQVYIALGNFMTSAALLGIDTCPMEGIQPEKYDELLGLSQKGYKTIVVGVAGYRAADDKYAAIPKVRFKNNDVIERVK